MTQQTIDWSSQQGWRAPPATPRRPRPCRANSRNGLRRAEQGYEEHHRRGRL